MLKKKKNGKIQKGLAKANLADYSKFAAVVIVAAVTVVDYVAEVVERDIGQKRPNGQPRSEGHTADLQ